MMRVANWQDKLEKLIFERKSMPFQWGVNDCCLWPADAVLTLTGVDHASDLRGTYKTARGAARALAYCGGIGAALARGGAPIAALCAGVGDVGLVHDEASQEVGAVCMGDVWLLVGKKWARRVAF